jgi:hypothetical protein
MHREFTNLLPVERQRSLSRDYFLRLGVVNALLLMVITFIAAVLLLPTYVFLELSSNAKEMRLANIKSTTSSADEKALAMRLAVLENNIVALTALANIPSASNTIRTILNVSRPGVRLSGFDYTSTTPKSPGKLIILGTSATRDALRNYQIALHGVSVVLTADLPISAYAKDTNIPFTITVTLSS